MLTDILVFYVVVGFLVNLIAALVVFYRGQEKGYVMIPHPMIFFLTIFSWPITVQGMISGWLNKGKNDES